MSSCSGSKIEEKTAPYSTLIRCGCCHKTEFDCKSRFKKCGVCKLEFYCSSECQSSQWKHHKNLCAAISSVNAETQVSQSSAMVRRYKLFPHWYLAVRNDIGNLLGGFFSTISPLTHMVLIYLKMNHDFDDRRSVRSGHIVQAFEMTSARLLSFKEFEGFCKSIHSEIMDQIRVGAALQAANPESVAMRFVVTCSINNDSHSPNYMHSVQSLVVNGLNIQKNNILSHFSISQREMMRVDMSWFVATFKAQMQKHLKTACVSSLHCQ